MKRRTIITTITSFIAVSGCLSQEGKNSNMNSTNKSTPENEETTTSPTEETTESMYDVYIENKDSDSHCLFLEITNGEDKIIDGEYRLKNTGQIIRNAVQAGDSYTVTVAIQNSNFTEYEWDARSCPDDLGRDLLIQINNSEISIFQNECDGIIVGGSSYRPAKEAENCENNS